MPFARRLTSLVASIGDRMDLRSLPRRARARFARPAPPEVAPWVHSAAPPWSPLPSAVDTSGVVCNICRWSGPAFGGVAHSEAALCPRCGAIARDRFLFWSMQRGGDDPGRAARLLETSPRLGPDYRAAMGRWFAYLCSDYDERAHAGTIRLDLQAIDLPDASLDVILTPHVLEHVPDTDRALAELRRVLAPGGRMYLQVPVLQGRTAPPTTPEFHGDDTPVFWRFGFDLTARLRAGGFDTTLLCTAAWDRAVRAGTTHWPEPVSPEFDVDDLLAGVIAEDLAVVADDDESRRHGFDPAYMFLTWRCIAR